MTNLFQQRNMKAARLTEAAVREIRVAYNQGATQGELSRRHQVSIVQIGRIVRGESWQHVPLIEPRLGEGELKEIGDRMLALSEEVQGREKLQVIARELNKANALIDELQQLPRSPLDE